MDLNLKNRLFIVTGATSGFGNAVTRALVNEQAKVIVNGRDKEKLQSTENTFKNNIEVVLGDISTGKTIEAVKKNIFPIHKL